MIRLIAAVGLDNSLGKNNQLLWHLKSDLQHFRELTKNSTVVMGSNTFRSVGRPLPNRINIVLTRNKELNIQGIVLAHSIEEVLNNYNDIWVIGGEQIYKQFLPYADEIHLTVVMKSFPHADTYLPKLEEEWRIFSNRWKLKDKDNEYNHLYLKLIRGDRYN